MSKSTWSVFVGSCALLMAALFAIPSNAQTAEVKAKPTMYTYIANWQIPREHWADMQKSVATRSAVMSKAVADGTIVGYGDDLNLVHTPDNETHDTWWSAMSMAGVVKVLDQLMAGEMSSTPNAAAPTKHWDEVVFSHYYNWKPGAYTGGYVKVAAYKLKADAPDDAVDTLSIHLLVPLLEKALADGSILEYEIDETAIHTSTPGTFMIVYVTPTPEGLDSTASVIRDSIAAHPLMGSAFGSMTDENGHRDELLKGNGVFK